MTPNTFTAQIADTKQSLTEAMWTIWLKGACTIRTTIIATTMGH